MKSSIAVVWLAALLALLSACRESVPRLPRLDSDARILAFGDSPTYGYGAEPSESYPAVLSVLIGRNVINEGVPGETSAEGLQRLPGVLEETTPALVILCLGGNDMLRQQSRDAMRRNLAAMIRLVRDQDRSVVMIGVPEPRLIGGLSAEPSYAALAKEFGLPLEREALPTILHDRQRKSDEIHPNAAGYRDLAQAVAELLRKAGAI